MSAAPSEPKPEPDASTTAPPDQTPSHLTPSELGTKEYWESAYATELHNHSTSNSTDEGTIWFSTSQAEPKILRYLSAQHEQLFLFKDFSTDAGHPSSFLDLGTGNGHFLFELRRRGWAGTAVGVDYSRKSVELARRIAAAREGRVAARRSGDVQDDGAQAEEESRAGDEDGEEGGEQPSTEPVTFVVHDVMKAAPEELEAMPDGGFDVVLDKGTFDAVSLSAELDADGRRLCESYASRVLPLVRLNGLLIVTSCNWTEEELRHWFERDGMRTGSFAWLDRIEYPSFTFGGRKGSSVVTVVFRKLARK